MSSFQSIQELIRGLQKGSALLNDMFLKRKAITIKYDDALEALGGDENRLQFLIQNEILCQIGNKLELEEIYLRFFEEVLAATEEINTATVRAYVDKLNLAINSYLAVSQLSRKGQYLREIRYAFQNIAKVTRRNVKDLKEKIELTYKTEPDFKIKELKLRDYDNKRQQISELINETRKVMETQQIFMSGDAGYELKDVLSFLKTSLRESSHSLISIEAQIIDYLNKVQYQSKLIAKIRRLKYLRDQFLIEEATDIRKVIKSNNDLWLEERNNYFTKVSLDYLHNEDSALEILAKIRKELSGKVKIKSKVAEPLTDDVISSDSLETHYVSRQALYNGFAAQSRDLFAYVIDYPYKTDLSREEKLVIFLQIATQYGDKLNFTARTGRFENVDYPIIYPV